MKQDNFWKGTIKTETPTYGRAINVSTGLILGLLIDKMLLWKTQGASSLFPPVSVLLMTKGTTLGTIRFDRKFNKYVEKFLSHMVTK